MRWSMDSILARRMTQKCMVSTQSGQTDGVPPTSINEEEQSEHKKSPVQLFPNPARNEMVNVKFYMERGTKVDIAIRDMKGTLVRYVRKGEYYSQGEHFVHIDGDNLNPGTYLIVIEVENKSFGEKLQIIK